MSGENEILDVYGKMQEYEKRYKKAEANTAHFSQKAAKLIGEVESLRAEIDTLAEVLLQEFGGPTKNESACEMAVRLLREMREALGWYEEKTRLAYEFWLAFQENSDPDKYTKYHPCDQIDIENALLSDGGKRAREALSGGHGVQESCDHPWDWSCPKCVKRELEK